VKELVPTNFEYNSKKNSNEGGGDVTESADGKFLLNSGVIGE